MKHGPKLTRGVALSEIADKILREIAEHDCCSCSSVIERALMREHESMKRKLKLRSVANGDETPTERKDSGR